MLIIEFYAVYTLYNNPLFYSLHCYSVTKLCYSITDALLDQSQSDNFFLALFPIWLTGACCPC